jgi:predicted nucleic acid-binding protein
MKVDMKPRIYIETSIPSYLTSRRSRDLIAAANQELTQEWWETRKDDFDLVISEFVSREAAADDPDAAKNRLAAITGIPELNITNEVSQLAQILIDKVPLPEKVLLDALHIAVATIHGIDYLLTWNCTHINNAEFRPKIEALCRLQGYEPPIICTPQELLKV